MYSYEPLPISLVEAAEEQLGARWRKRIIDRIDASLERELRKDGPPQLPTSEQQAMAMLKGIATELQHASVALEYAARELKNITGKGVQAGKVYAAAQRAKAAAEGLLA